MFSGGNNVAVGGKATQSSTEGRAAAKLAIDNKFAGKATADSFARTKDSDEDPWWQIDLGDPKAIDRIVFWHHAAGSVPKAFDIYQVKVLDAAQRRFGSARSRAGADTGPHGTCEEILIGETAEVYLRWVEGRRRTSAKSSQESGSLDAAKPRPPRGPAGWD